MLAELEERRCEIESLPITSIYFGGGTPSVLLAHEIGDFINAIMRSGRVSANAEITLEANPDDLSTNRIREFKSAGINRFSIGIQTFNDHTLTALNRTHNSEQAEAAIKHAQDAGIDNITADLIYGLPGSDLATCKKDLIKLIDLDIPHLSCYNLTIEPNTALHSFVAKGKIEVPDEDETAMQFELGMSTLESAGFEHYEISNYAKPGYQSQHNSAYWNGEPYIGIGPSAHSFNGQTRRWNVSNNSKYMKKVDWFETEQLAPTDKYNEYVLTRLRTSLGCSIIEIQQFQPEFGQHFIKQFEPWIDTGHLTKNGKNITLTRTGKLIADRIVQDLFFIDES